ncbi:MAG: DUF2961 domain-containing protein [Pirellulales bacterium]|nr:DUF2961 domain-containing protein [Pirellulales bacterium]
MFRGLLLVAFALSTVPALASSLAEVSGPIDGRRMRASSTGPRERNRDHAVIPAGETITLAELNGPGIIQHIWFTVASDDFRYPATAVLRIYWDDHPEPSVQTPLGDFFAAGHGMRVNVNSEPVQVSAEGRAYNCYWPMPFRRKARIEVENQSDKKMKALYFYIDWLKLDKPKEDGYYFHARYCQERPHTPGHDYTILETTGRGNYVGTVLSSHCGCHYWFGEGNDRVFIDGETEPSLTGTGTEDYFNDAWGFRVFNHPYAGCTIFEGRSLDSRITAYRWHLRDPIPFQRSLRFTIENKGCVAYQNGKLFKRFHDRHDNYSSVAFWYQDKPATDVPALPPLDQRIDPELYFDIHALEKMAEIESSGRARLTFSRRLIPREFFHFQDAEPGAVLTFPIEIDKRGRHGVSLWKVATPDGGIYEIGLDDKIVERRLDFYDDGGVIEENGRINPLREARERKLGVFRLDPGKHTLRFKCVGRNPQSHLNDSKRPGYGLGLHGLSLRKIGFEDTDQYLIDSKGGRAANQ